MKIVEADDRCLVLPSGLDDHGRTARGYLLYDPPKVGLDLGCRDSL